MVPAFIVVALGVDATQGLVISQVVLSIALPVLMIALVMFTRRADIMGRFARPRSQRFDTGRPKISLSAPNGILDEVDACCRATSCSEVGQDQPIWASRKPRWAGTKSTAMPTPSATSSSDVTCGADCDREAGGLGSPTWG